MAARRRVDTGGGLLCLGALFLAAQCPAGRSQEEQAAGIAPAETFADASALAAWSFSNGREWPGARGCLEWRAGAGRAGDGAAALVYDFEGGGHYVAAIVRLPAHPEVRAVRLWVNKPAPNLTIFRARDADGEVFQKNLRYHYPGWQQLEISIGGWEASWGGDGAFRGPAKEFHILVENDGGNRVGSVLIDDVQWVYGEADAAAGAPGRTTYVESDFADGRWRYDGPAGGSFADGTWHYRFTPAQGRVHLVRERGILGRPLGMLLTVESDGSGHELVAGIGSHFQNFERSLGVLERRGEMRFAVPLGDMTGWRHFGGEDDGLVRYPLRLTGLGLVKRGQADEGRVRMLRLEFDTEFDPQTEAVWVIPRPPVADGAGAPGGGAGVRFPVELRSLADGPLAGEVRWSIHGADRRLREGVQAVELPAGGVPVAMEIAGEWDETAVLEGRFRFCAAALESRPASATIARVPAVEPDVVLNPDSRIGAGLYLYRFRGHPEARQWMERMCALAARAGVKWTREEFHWNWIEPRRGEFDFAFFDQLVETAQAHGISVYALCCYWTGWTKPYSEEGIADYCRYVEALVRRYGDRIKHWEVWNEPNVFFWSGPKELYPQLLKRAYETIKRVDPQAQVLGCSTAGIDTGFIKLVIDGGGPFDALTVHPYRGALDPPGFVQELRKTKELAGGRDVWITEMGWPSHAGGLSEREQAGYVARTYISALASGAVRSVAWYDFREDGDDPFYNEHHFGLVRSDLTPKMGYRTLATVGQLLGEAEFERELALPVGPPGSDDPPLIGFRFRRGTQRIAAAWSPRRARLVALKVKGENVRVLNAVGGPTGVAHPGGAWVALFEPDMPVYIVADGAMEVAGQEFPVAVRLSKAAVHPGEVVTYGLELDEFSRCAVHELPARWAAAPADGRGAYGVSVPADAAPGRYELIFRVEALWAEREFLLPVEVEVVPLLLRG